MFGIKVHIEFWPGSPYYESGTPKIELRNVTEIHYNYRVSQMGGYQEWVKLPDSSTLKEKMIAFESNIHQTGMTIPENYIMEFDTTPEIAKAENFQQEITMIPKKLYPLADLYFNFKEGISLPEQKFLRAKETGEYRAPKKGEWYLSGSIPEAYKAFADYPETSKFWIVKIVMIKTSTIEEVVQEF